MKISYLLSASIFSLVLAFSANAQEKEVSPYIAQSLPSQALNNILNSERVFCYTVEMPSEGYTGYTLDQMALTGYCGQVGEEKSLFIDEFFKTPENISTTVASCQIEPKIILRFIRGIDATDVLFSDTCPSFTVFYGGSFKSFNAAPAKKAVEAVAAVFSAGRVDFVSPALLNQTMPMGVVLNDQDKALLNKKQAAQPARNWSQPAQEEATKPAAQGWNRMKKN